MNEDEAKRIGGRLLNWGLYIRSGGMPNLGYPSWHEIMREYWGDTGTGTNAPHEIDALHLENIISTMDTMGRSGEGIGHVYAFILKLEYAEHGRPAQAKAEHVRAKFKVRCGERTYYYRLSEAKKAVHLFADPF